MGKTDLLCFNYCRKLFKTTKIRIKSIWIKFNITNDRGF